MSQRVEGGWLGIEGRFLDGDQVMHLLDLGFRAAILVERVAPDSPAARAGLRGGCVASRLEDEEVLLGGDLILAFHLAEAIPGSSRAVGPQPLASAGHVPVTFLREGRTMSTVVELADASAARPPVVQ